MNLDCRVFSLVLAFFPSLLGLQDAYLLDLLGFVPSLVQLTVIDDALGDRVRGQQATTVDGVENTSLFGGLYNIFH